MQKEEEEKGEEVEEFYHDTWWRFALVFYTFALCLGATDFLMFFAFLEKDVEYNIFLNHGEEQWRLNVMWISQTVPFALIMVDFFLNSLITIPRLYHVLILPFLLLYLFLIQLFLLMLSLL